MTVIKSINKFLLVMVVIALNTACSGGGGGGDEPDTTAPATTATPAGGTYGTVQSVTLTSNEVATIYYSLDGNDPSIGGGNTISGTSPVSAIAIPAGTTVLKYFAVDGSNNQEAIKSQTYIVDVVAPSVTLSAPAPGPGGLLSTVAVGWQSDEAGSYIVELGGNGAIGSGTAIATGTAQAGVTITNQIEGLALSYSASTPLWMYVTDSVGHIGSTYVDLNLKPMVTIAVGSELTDITLKPDGLKAYVTDTGSNNVIVIDTNPSSGTYNTTTASVAVGTRPYRVTFIPDGTRAYVTNNGSTNLDVDSLSEIATASDSVTDTITLGTNSAPTGIAVAPDGTRAYFLSFDGLIYILDTDSGSVNYNTIIDSITRSLLLGGVIAITPDGSTAVANWQGSIAHAVDMFDADPGSVTYKDLIGSPIPVVSGLSGDVAISSDSAYAYVSSSYYDVCGVCKIDLQTQAIAAKNSTDYSALQNTLALSPDDTALLTGGLNGTKLSIFNASDMTFRGSVELGNSIRSLAITPDGTRAYLLDYQGTGTSDIVMLPLQ